jgi:hypothetical protein
MASAIRKPLTRNVRDLFSKADLQQMLQRFSRQPDHTSALRDSNCFAFSPLRNGYLGAFSIAQIDFIVYEKEL